MFARDLLNNFFSKKRKKKKVCSSCANRRRVKCTRLTQNAIFYFRVFYFILQSCKITRTWWAAWGGKIVVQFLQFHSLSCLLDLCDNVALFSSCWFIRQIMTVGARFVGTRKRKKIVSTFGNHKHQQKGEWNEISKHNRRGRLRPLSFDYCDPINSNRSRVQKQ